MPSAPKPKEFVAARNFRYANRTYHVGDPITDRRVIGELIERWGTKYLTRKPAPAEPSAEDSATQPPTAESPKED